ncbi:eight transmembrane protein EpsH [Alkalidesulfovibrio alkalitolerans DSM 16529]|uniref:Eight transmembrane protein EpsH n=1 Tax=Alkalidesulfovibrio alkalitolerans DSM 16529 TaxID=1121439 RepID=S7T239_9BACT|nr:exosortase A [Alkalidesulfovibrio alkalitolerans]EPR30580.1 eight transmembrane protein EpsH [Alkalidesulfovibrio alkalitolerans DSM 16529]
MTLAGSLREHRYEIVAFLVLLGVVYHSIFSAMVLDWYRDDNYSHGFLVPFIAGYLAYRRRDELAAAEVRPSNLGLLVIAGGFGLLMLGWFGTEYFTMRASMVVVLAGSVLYLFGRQVFGLLFAPIAYLLLMIPIPYIIYDAAAFPLKLLVTEVSVKALKVMGIVVWQEGNILMFPNITLEVADACSGLRSIMSLLALGAAYALVLYSSLRDRAILILSTLPIAVFTNCLRVIATGVLAQYIGSAAAEGFFHEFAGLFVFLTAVAMFLGLGAILRRIP